MSIFKKEYRKKAPSKLVKVFDAGEFIEEETHSKPAAKKSYAFWIMGIQKFEEMKEDDVQGALGGMVELMAKLICLSTCNKDGDLIFSLSEDLEDLSELDDPIKFEKLFMCACEVNGIVSLGESISKSFREISGIFDGLDVALEEEKSGAKKAPRKKRTGVKSS